MADVSVIRGNSRLEAKKDDVVAVRWRISYGIESSQELSSYLAHESERR